MSLEMAKKVIVPQKKNYVPQFLKQQDINSYYIPAAVIFLYAVCKILVRDPPHCTLDTMSPALIFVLY